MRRVRGAAKAILLVAAALAAGGCGYRVAGRANTLPSTIKTIAVPAFDNRSNSYRIEQRLTEAVVREMLVDTRYRVVSNEQDGDAVLHGVVKSLGGGVVVFDQSTGRATTVLVSLVMEVSLRERSTGRVLYQNGNFVFREPYETSTDLNSFFQESGPAMDRLSRDVARRLVAEMRESY